MDAEQLRQLLATAVAARASFSRSLEPDGIHVVGAVWIVLGVCRLHYTLATGGIASKEEAGQYGLHTFSEQWHRALNEALRIRRADRARADVASALGEID